VGLGRRKDWNGQYLLDRLKGTKLWLLKMSERERAVVCERSQAVVLQHWSVLGGAAIFPVEAV
jgi:hypothetical protein